MDYFAPENAQAVCQFRAWLEASGIPNTPGKEGGDVMVIAKDGRQVKVVISTDITVQDKTAKEIISFLSFQLDSRLVIPPKPPIEDAVVVSAHTFKKLKHSVSFFCSFLSQLGYPPTNPVDRGEQPEKKPLYTDNLELVAMRHREFRKVPNPSKEHLERYREIIESACWTFLRTNRDFCAYNMLEHQDLMTYATVWTCNYIGLYEIPQERVTDCDNEKLLHRHLSQRFAEFRNILWKKNRNCVPEMEVAYLGIAGEVPNDNGMDIIIDRDAGQSEANFKETNRVFAVTQPIDRNDDGPDEDYTKRNCKLDTHSVRSRRRSANSVLTNLLENLGHDRMVTTLQEAAENFSISPDARDEAKRRLTAHGKTCKACHTILAEENEDMAGVHNGSVEE